MPAAQLQRRAGPPRRDGGNGVRVGVGGNGIQGKPCSPGLWPRSEIRSSTFAQLKRLVCDITDYDRCGAGTRDGCFGLVSGWTSCGLASLGVVQRPVLLWPSAAALGLLGDEPEQSSGSEWLWPVEEPVNADGEQDIVGGFEGVLGEPGRGQPGSDSGGEVRRSSGSGPDHGGGVGADHRGVWMPAAPILARAASTLRGGRTRSAVPGRGWRPGGWPGRRPGRGPARRKRSPRSAFGLVSGDKHLGPAARP